MTNHSSGCRVRLPYPSAGRGWFQPLAFSDSRHNGRLDCLAAVPWGGRSVLGRVSLLKREHMLNGVCTLTLASTASHSRVSPRHEITRPGLGRSVFLIYYSLPTADSRIIAVVGRWLIIPRMPRYAVPLATSPTIPHRRSRPVNISDVRSGQYRKVGHLDQSTSLLRKLLAASAVQPVHRLRHQRPEGTQGPGKCADVAGCVTDSGDNRPK